MTYTTNMSIKAIYNRRQANMNASQVHNELKNDAAYNHSRAHKDYQNMRIVLRAHGFKHSFEHAAVMVEYKES